MQRLLEYIAHHPFLAAGAVAAAIAVIFSEVRERIQSFAALSSMQAVRLINQGALVLDLRSKESYDAGHINDARHVPAAELEAQAEKFKKWREKTVITYGDAAVAGATAARTLTRLGFTKVFNLEGGVAGWTKDNMPLTKSETGNKGGGKGAAK